jgi:hypothetical protein
MSQETTSCQEILPEAAAYIAEGQELNEREALLVIAAYAKGYRDCHEAEVNKQMASNQQSERRRR